MSTPEPISEAQVRKVASLSRLAISDGEIGDFAAKLSAVIGYIERLNEHDLTGVEPLAHVGDTHNRLRDDTPGPTLPTDVLMRMAPASMPPFVLVPKVQGDGGGA